MQKDLTTTVEEMLRKYPETRDSNNLLLFAVHRAYGVDKCETYASVLLKINRGELPPFESVTRARRKIVEQHPELDANAVVKALREKQEDMYETYARS